MRLYKAIFGCVFVSTTIVSCRSAQQDRSVSGLQDDSAKGCGELDAFASGKMTGEDVFALTSRCVFNRETHTLRIRILGNTMDKVLVDGAADRDTGFGHVIEFNLDGISIENVGIKVRGNTSRGQEKRQFKFKFDADEVFSVSFDPVTKEKTVTPLTFIDNVGRTFFGLDGISIRASSNDPSMIRERVSSKIFTEGERLQRTDARGGLVYRTSFVKFSVSFNQTKAEGNFKTPHNGFFYDYRGFYSFAENIDKTFLISRFQKGSNKLEGFYLFQADKALAQFTRNSFVRKGWSTEFVDGRKAKDREQILAGESKLFDLFDFLETKPSEGDLEKIVNIDSVVNYTAAVILSAHWDSLLSNRNNDYLFFNGEEQKWQIIAFDLDNSLGVPDPKHRQFLSTNIFAPSIKNKTGFFEHVFSKDHPKFRGKLKDRLREYLADFYNKPNFDQMIDKFEETVRADAADWEGPRDFEFIKTFANERRALIKPQL